jgi:hypothetical protein
VCGKLLEKQYNKIWTGITKAENKEPRKYAP